MNANFQFFGRINDFLPSHDGEMVHTFSDIASIKDMVESLGIPHPEIGALMVNNQPVDFTYRVQDQDQIVVYSDIVNAPANAIPLRPPMTAKPRFILDTHLGRLASYLRMLGFDTLYRNDYPDDELAQVSHDEQRILLTRDYGLLKRSLVVYGYFVRNTNPQKRLKELVDRFALAEHVEPFLHCMACNGFLQAVDKASIHEELMPETVKYFNDFHQCKKCEKIYWQGSHYDRMQALMADVLP